MNTLTMYSKSNENALIPINNYSNMNTNTPEYGIRMYPNTNPEYEYSIPASYLSPA